MLGEVFAEQGFNVGCVLLCGKLVEVTVQIRHLPGRERERERERVFERLKDRQTLDRGVIDREVRACIYAQETREGGRKREKVCMCTYINTYV